MPCKPEPNVLQNEIANLAKDAELCDLGESELEKGWTLT